MLAHTSKHGSPRGTSCEQRYTDASAKRFEASGGLAGQSKHCAENIGSVFMALLVHQLSHKRVELNPDLFCSGYVHYPLQIFPRGGIEEG